jgi:hypothetical protein
MTRKQQNQSFDQKKGSADQTVSGSRQSMAGSNIARGDSSMNMGGRSDYGGPEGNSRERKTSRNGSDSNES